MFRLQNKGKEKVKKFAENYNSSPPPLQPIENNSYNKENLVLVSFEKKRKLQDKLIF